MKCLPKRRGLHSAESSHSHRICEAVSASVSSHTQLLPALPCLALAFGLPPGTSRQLGLPQLKHAYLTGCSSKSHPSIGLLELTAPCGGMPELLAPCGGMPELLAPCIGMPELLAPCGGMPEPLTPCGGMPEPLTPCGGTSEPLDP
jgi:hypothetical protein